MVKITAVPWGGLANRMKAVASVVSFSREHGAELEIVWFNNSELNAPFHKLFRDIEGVHIRDASPLDFFTLLHPLASNLYLPSLYRLVAFDRVIEMDECGRLKDNHSLLEGAIGKSKRVYIRNCYDIYDISDISSVLRLDSMVEQKISNFIRSHFATATIGVHIRRTDNIVSISESPIELFEDAISRELAASGETMVYLASDSPSDKEYLKAKFPGRIITYDGELSRNSEDGIVVALMELYLLSRCKKIYGSSGSSFSELAAYIGKNELNILKK